MAKMIPASRAQAEKEIKAPTELEVWDKLASQLSDDFLCIMSIHYGEGENDFLIVHRDYPLLFLEIKGGTVFCDARMETWERKTTAGMETMRSPLVQVQKNRRFLLDLFKKVIPGAPPYIGAEVGLVFPASSRTNFNCTDGHLVVCAEEMHQLGVRLEAILTKNEDGGRHPPVGQPFFNSLNRFYNRTPLVQVPLRAALEEDQRLIEALSSDQINLLSRLEGNKRIAFHGSAGSGKTILAMEKALRSVEEGKKTVLLCFNERLRDMLRATLPESTWLTINNFHGLCEDYIRRAGIKNGDRSVDPDTYYEQLIGKMDEALVQNDEKFDVVIVDEAQDFKEDWWLIVEELVRNRNDSELYTFSDSMQNIQGGADYTPTGAFTYLLNQNWRNTRQIHRFLEDTWLHDQGAVTESLGPDGQAINLIEVPSARSMETTLRHTLEDLVNRHKIDPENIAILTGGSMASSALRRGQTIGSFTLTDQPGKGQQILFETVRRFKGLEKQVVIVVEIDRQEAALRYVAFSRATVLLTVICLPETYQQLRPVEDRTA